MAATHPRWRLHSTSVSLFLIGYCSSPECDYTETNTFSGEPPHQGPHVLLPIDTKLDGNQTKGVLQVVDKPGGGLCQTRIAQLAECPRGGGGEGRGGRWQAGCG